MKRLFAAFLISISLFTSVSFAYDDIPHDSPYFYAIEYLRRNEVYPETKNFRPDILINKADFVKSLVLLNSPGFKPDKTVKLPFEDTEDHAWYAPYFDEAINLGILTDRDIKAEPYRKLSLFEALELLFHSKSIPIPKTYVGTVPYTDVAKNKRVTPLIMRALEFDIVEPERPDYFGIYRKITRAKAAHMIYKMDLVDLMSPSFESSRLNEYDSRLKKIINSWDLLNSSHLFRDTFDADKLADAAIKAMAEAVDDPYTVYLNSEENSLYSDDLDGEIEGIGAFIGVEDDGSIIIVSPIIDSPAFNAGIKAGDIILKVDDFDAVGAPLNETVSKIKGPKGTTVELTLSRNGQRLTISVVRDVISIDSLEYEVIENGTIMYVELMQFNQNAPNEFMDVVHIISGNPDIKGMILDVRDNPGGLLESSNRILNYLLPAESEVVSIVYNSFTFTQYSTGLGDLADLPMVVLINKGSASASEIVAGALKDHKIATVIGETSFGKGTVQELNYFGDNSSLKLTVAKWLTPNGHDLNENGVTPDIEVINGTATTTDNQFQRAIMELRKKIR